MKFPSFSRTLDRFKHAYKSTIGFMVWPWPAILAPVPSKLRNDGSAAGVVQLLEMYMQGASAATLLPLGFIATPFTFALGIPALGAITIGAPFALTGAFVKDIGTSIKDKLHARHSHSLPNISSENASTDKTQNTSTDKTSSWKRGTINRIWQKLGLNSKTAIKSFTNTHDTSERAQAVNKSDAGESPDKSISAKKVSPDNSKRNYFVGAHRMSR